MKQQWLLWIVVAGFLAWSLGGTSVALGSDGDLYSLWEGDLRRYVDSKGDVNYRDWKESRKGLDSFVQAASRVTAQQYSQMSKDEKLAFWINVYNASTVKQILDHYPIRRSGLNLYPENSIRQISGVWDKYRISAAGRSVTLNDIEHKILRSELKEPLIHFAINCASRSCPKLSNKAYRGKSLSEYLKEAARDFANDQTRNKIDAFKRTVELSQIFDWFGDDFKEHYGGNDFPGRSAKESAVLNLFVRYLSAGEKRELLLSKKFSLRYLPYDWSLNEQGAGR